MTKTITRLARAKINYSLDVGELRPDGFHEVQTVMQTISLCDTVDLELLTGGCIVIETDSPHVPGGSGNLAWQAAHLFLRSIGAGDLGVRIRLTKRIPVQAGLGGGSSDAASVLMCLNELMEGHLSREDLAHLGGCLGSDVPFFLFGGTAFMQGRGEVGQPLPDAPELTMVIVKPAGGVSTAEAYRALDSLPGVRQPGSPAVIRSVERRDRDALVGSMSNHFELVVGQLAPAALRAMEALQSQGAECVHLCGSGSAVFGVFARADSAHTAAAALGSEWEAVHVCSTVSAREAAAT